MIKTALNKLIIIAIALTFLNINQVKGAELEEIIKRGYLIIGVKNNQPPLAYEDKKGN